MKPKLPKDSKDQSASEIVAELMGERFVGGTLAQLANYADLFSRMSDAVLLVDPHGHRVLECNPVAKTLLQRSETEILGQTVEELIGNVSEDLWKGHVKVSVEYQDKKIGHRYFEVKSDPLQILDYVEIRQLIIHDVTESRRAQKEIETANEILRKLSMTDAMTGLWNLRYFQERIQLTHEASCTENQPYGVIFIDVDHFKQFNDKNGHPAGDEVLKKVAHLLTEVCGPKQTPARYGGEEFVVLCQEADETQTLLIAEKIRKVIEGTPFPHGENQPLGKVTASVGTAVFPLHGNAPKDVLHAADLALYESKRMGRNRVTAFSELQENKKVG